MANYEILKAAIRAVIKQNGNNEITGDLLQQQLLAMVSSLGANYQFVGVATPTSNPGTPDQNVFYIAGTPGVYSNFSNLVVDNEVVVFLWNGTWLKQNTGVKLFDFSFSPIGFVENAYLVYGGGINKSAYPVGGYKCAITDFIPCSNGDSVYVLTGMPASYSVCSCLYDSNKNCIQSIRQTTAGGYLSFTVENANAAYFRASVHCVQTSFVRINNDKIYYLGEYCNLILEKIDKLPTKDNNILLTSNAVATEFLREKNEKLYIVAPSETQAIYPVELSAYGLRAGDIISFKSLTNNRPNGTGLHFLDSNDNVISSNLILYDLDNRNDKQYCKIPDNAVKLSAECYVAQINIEIEIFEYYPAQSSYVTEELKTTLNGLDIIVPSVPIIANVTRVSNGNELSSAIQAFNNGNDDLSIILTNDIALEPANFVSINNNNRNLTILGNGHCIYPKGGETFEPDGFKGKYAFSAFNTEPNYALISEDGEYIEQGKTKPFIALSGVLNEDGTPAGSSLGIKKILLPYALRNISISENDHVYINFIAGTTYERKTELVIRIDGGYLFFYQSSSYEPNVIENTHFRLFNFDDGVGYYTREEKVFFPSKYNKLYCPVYTTNPFTITNASGKIALYDVKFVGFTRYGYAVINTINTGTIIIQGCRFVGAYTCLYETGTSQGGYIYIDNCYFENVKERANYSAGNHVIITNNKSYNVGTCEFNAGQHFRAGNLSSYIGYNELINYGYCGVVGSASTCVIEHNLLKYTEEYADYAKVGLVADSGAIYTGLRDEKCIIRFNKIINYCGIYGNYGIYLDDGVNNVFVIGNVIENNCSKDSYSIFARRASDTENNKNTNRIVAHNIVDSGILVVGSTRNTPNGCFVGYNIICKKASHVETYIADVQGQEQQFMSNKSYIEDGMLHGNVYMDSWIL